MITVTLTFQLEPDDYKLLKDIVDAYDPKRPDFPYTVKETDTTTLEQFRTLNKKGLISFGWIGSGMYGAWMNITGRDVVNAVESA